MRIPVEGYPHLYRDSETGAIINCDTNGYYNYLNTVSKKEKEKAEIENMKNDISEIKILLQQLLQKNESK